MFLHIRNAVVQAIGWFVYVVVCGYTAFRVDRFFLQRVLTKGNHKIAQFRLHGVTYFARITDIDWSSIEDGREGRITANVYGFQIQSRGWRDPYEAAFWSCLVFGNRSVANALVQWQVQMQENGQLTSLTVGYEQALRRMRNALDGLRGTSENYARLFKYVDRLTAVSSYDGSSKLLALRNSVRAPLDLGGRKPRTEES